MGPIIVKSNILKRKAILQWYSDPFAPTPTFKIENIFAAHGLNKVNKLSTFFSLFFSCFENSAGSTTLPITAHLWSMSHGLRTTALVE